MASIGTRTVEIDSELLDRLRQHSPGRSDRETLERVARIQLGFETIRAVQERSEAAGVDDDEVMAEAVRAVRETRQARSTRRAAGCAASSLTRTSCLPRSPGEQEHHPRCSSQESTTAISTPWHARC